MAAKSTKTRQTEAAELLARLKAKGVTFSIVDGRLNFSAPRKLDNRDRDGLYTFRAELKELVESGADVGQRQFEFKAK